MSSGDFNVSVAVLLVLGGVAALLLATFLALGGYGSRSRAAARNAAARSAVSPASSAPAVTSAAPETEIEYQLEDDHSSGGLSPP